MNGKIVPNCICVVLQKFPANSLDSVHGSIVFLLVNRLGGNLPLATARRPTKSAGPLVLDASPRGIQLPTKLCCYYCITCFGVISATLTLRRRIH